MIKYSKLTIITMVVFSITIGPIFCILHYLSIGFKFHIIGILGILLIFFGVLFIKEIKGKLIIGKNSVVVDGRTIPASAIREIVPEEKGWKITIRTWTDKDAEIYLGEYVVFTSKEKRKTIYNQLVKLKKKKR
jgi:hypothetical protein